MVWNEEKHPRAKDGKFTFKNGGRNDTTHAGEVLYGRIEKNNKEIEKEKERLLNILGSKATQADILYGTVESLSKKVKNSNSFMTKKEAHKTGFQKDIAKHETLRQLSVYCYDNGHQKLPKDFKRVGYFNDKSNGLDAVVVENEKAKEVVIAYRGMKATSKEDIKAVAQTIATKYNKQQKSAQTVYEKIKNNPKYKNYEIYTTGTSLGGHLAQYVAGKNNLKSATFNTFHGTKDVFLKEMERKQQSFKIYPDNIVNYRNEEDKLSRRSTKDNIGLSLNTKANIVRRDSFPPPHSAENIGDLHKAEMKNINFKDHYTVGLDSTKRKK